MPTDLDTHAENAVVSTADIVARGWDAVGRGDWDALIADYTEDMIFVMPGQQDVLTGKPAFRGALDNLGAALPAGFAITGLRQIGDGPEVVSILDWTCDKIPEGSRLAVLFRLKGALVAEERWFIDTQEWKAAF